MFSHLPVVLSLLSFAAALPAQDLLVIERQQDRRGRDALLRKMKRISISLKLHKADAQELTNYLRLATGGKIPFILSLRKASKEDLPKVTLHLKRLRLHNALAVLQEQSGVRFVYRGGVVLVRPKHQVKEFTYLRFYDVRAATFKLPNFKAPKLGLGRGEEQVEDDEEEGRPASGFDADQLVEMIRTHVTPDAWDGTASINQSRSVLSVRHTDTGHKKVRALLVKLGAIAPVRRIVRRIPSRLRLRRVPVRKPAVKKSPGKKLPEKAAPKKPAK